MKKTSIVSLFLCTSMLILVAVCAYQYMYYNLEREKLEAKNSALEARLEKTVQVDTTETPKVTKDTQFVLEVFHKDKSTFEKKEGRIPSEYIGLTREELILYLDDLNDQIEEVEKVRGYEGCELISFSKERVIVRDTYGEPLAESFYLVVEDHYITVYKEDRETIYAYTGIHADTLPKTMREEVFAGKEIHSMEELYNFLETYSS